MHNHTSLYSTCSIISPDLLIKTYIKNKIDGICITEHNNLWKVKEQERLIENYKNKIKIFFGVELNTDIGHVLMFGSGIEYFGDYIRFDIIEKKIDKNKTALIWAHPFRWPVDPKLKINKKFIKKFDAIELYNGNLSNNVIIKTRNFFNPMNVKFTGGSDTHSYDMSVNYATEFKEQINTLDELVKNLKEGNYKPVKL